MLLYGSWNGAIIAASGRPVRGKGIPAGGKFARAAAYEGMILSLLASAVEYQL
jgi:hypothetical protein